MTKMHFVFGSSLITLICFLFLFCIFISFCTKLIKKPENGFFKAFMQCQLMMNIIGLICVFKMIEFATFLSMGYVKIEQFPVYFAYIYGFILNVGTGVLIALFLTQFRFKEPWLKKWYSYSNFVIVPCAVGVLLFTIITVVTKV